MKVWWRNCCLAPSILMAKHVCDVFRHYCVFVLIAPHLWQNHNGARGNESSPCLVVVTNLWQVQVLHSQHYSGYHLTSHSLSSGSNPQSGHNYIKVVALINQVEGGAFVLYYPKRSCIFIFKNGKKKSNVDSA
jgi:hypothetical protein